MPQASTKMQNASADIPIASLLIPAYKSQFFEEALRSCVGQTCRSTEIIVCDDSTDENIEAIVERFNNNGASIQYHRNKVPLGARDNYLKCLSLARGTYVKFLNDDDTMALHCVERMLAIMSAHPDVSLVACRRKRIDEAGKELNDTLTTRPIVKKDQIMEAKSLVRVLLSIEKNVIGEPSSVMFRREYASHFLPDPMSFGGETSVGWGDLALWLNLLTLGNAAYLTEPMCGFRIHSGQMQRDPTFLAKVRGRNPMKSLRKVASSMGLYSGTTKVPDPRILLYGIKCRGTDEKSGWNRTAITGHSMLAFTQAFVRASRSIARIS